MFDINRELKVFKLISAFKIEWKDEINQKNKRKEMMFILFKNQFDLKNLFSYSSLMIEKFQKSNKFNEKKNN